jgi:hypothetical protein
MRSCYFKFLLFLVLGTLAFQASAGSFFLQTKDSKANLGLAVSSISLFASAFALSYLDSIRTKCCSEGQAQCCPEFYNNNQTGCNNSNIECPSCPDGLFLKCQNDQERLDETDTSTAVKVTGGTAVAVGAIGLVFFTFFKGALICDTIPEETSKSSSV